MDETERRASRALRAEDRLHEVSKALKRDQWPNWTLRAVKQRICQETNPHYTASPLKARTLRAILRETGDDELFALLEDDYHEGQARAAERKAKRHREMRVVRSKRQREARA